VCRLAASRLITCVPPDNEPRTWPYKGGQRLVGEGGVTLARSWHTKIEQCPRAIAPFGVNCKRFEELKAPPSFIIKEQHYGARCRRLNGPRIRRMDRRCCAAQPGPTLKARALTYNELQWGLRLGFGPWKSQAPFSRSGPVSRDESRQPPLSRSRIREKRERGSPSSTALHSVFKLHFPRARPLPPTSPLPSPPCADSHTCTRRWATSLPSGCAPPLRRRERESEWDR
jgi:hypothetical protein